MSASLPQLVTEILHIPCGSYDQLEKRDGPVYAPMLLIIRLTSVSISRSEFISLLIFSTE